MIECVVNVSEGRDQALLARLAAAAGDDLLDIHTDPHHHRSVFTIAPPEAVYALARLAVVHLDVRRHAGVHPRLGVVDVVPFVPLGESSMDDALVARDAFALWASSELGVPCFLYGPDRTLPDIRRRAWHDLAPDLGPRVAHPTAGAMCVGARRPLVAFNLWLRQAEVARAKRVAALVRGPHVRALGLQVGDHVQVSLNLVNPEIVGPADAYDLVASHTEIDRCELVGLVPASVLNAIAPSRWAQLDLAEDRTIESRLSRRGGSSVRGEG